MSKLYFNLLDTLSDLVCVLTGKGTVQKLNETAIETLEVSPHSIEKKLFYTFFGIEKNYFDTVVEKLKINPAEPQNLRVEYSISENKAIKLNWHFVFDTDQNVIYGVAKNPVEDKARLQTHYLDQLERKIMEQAIDPSTTLSSILNKYIKGLEDIFPALKASILKIEDNKVWHVASHSLPKEFTQTINGEAIGPNNGSCGTAAYLKKRIIVSDISTDPLWEQYKELALPLGLKACWSQPVFNAHKEVVATFANYYGSKRVPSEKELKVFERSASLIGVMIEHFQKKSDLESNSELYSYVNLATNDAIYDWNLTEDHIQWGESFTRLFGHELTEAKYPLSKWEQLVHPKDLEDNLFSLRSCLENATRHRWKAQYRFKKADGNYAHVEEKGYIIRDTKGNPIRMIGVLSDIYEIWLAEQKKEVLKIFSHIFNKAIPFKATMEAFTEIPLTHTVFSISEVWLTNTNKDEMSRIAFKSNVETNNFYTFAKEISTLPFGKGISGLAAKKKTPIFWNHTKSNKHFIREEAAKQAGIKNMVALPIYTNANTVGVWLLGTKNKRIDTLTMERLWEEINPFLAGEIIRKQVEDELTRLVELAPDVICMLDNHGNFKRINTAGCELLEYTEEEIVNKNFKQFIHPKDRDNFEAHITQLLRNKATEQIQSRFITQSHKTIWLDWTSAVTPDQDFIYAVAKNSTEKRRLKHLLDSANEMARIGSWEFDIKNNTIYWSPMTREIHESPVDFEPRLEEGISFYKKEYQSVIKKAVTEAIEKGIPWDFEAPIITAKGNERWVRTMGEPEYKNKECIKLYGSFQDVHKRKMAEIKATKMLAEKNEILERIGDAFFAVDKKWNVTYWNAIAEKVLQTPKEKILGKNLWEVFEDAKKLPSYRLYHEAMKTGETVHFEEYYAPVNRWFEITAYPSSTGLSVYFLDVSLRKVAEQEIRESNERFEKVAKATNDAIWDWDIVNDTQYRGDGFKILFGHEVSKIEDKHFWSNHLHPSDKAEVEKSIYEAVRDKKVINWTHEYRYKKANNKYAYIIDRGVIIRNKKGEAVRMVGAMTDITHRIKYQKSLKKLNTHLQESQQKYMDLFHLSPIPMWLYDIDTYRFLEVNKAAIKHYGYSREEFLAQTILDIRPKSEINKVKNSIKNIRNKERNTFEEVFKHRKKNGEIIYVEVRGNEIKYNQKRAEVILAIDITEKLAYIEAIESQNKRLKQIAWDQSHLVRAPLSRLMGIIDLIKHGSLDLSEKEELLVDVVEAANEMDATVKEISDKSRVLKA